MSDPEGGFAAWTIGASRVERLAAEGHLPPREFARLWQDELRDCVSVIGSSPVPVAPLLLTSAVTAELSSGAVRLLALCREAVINLGGSWKERQIALGVPDHEVPLMTDSEWELALCASTARPDVLLTDSGPQFIELNVSASFGGPVEVHLMNRAWSALHPNLDLGQDPLTARASMICELVRSLGDRSTVAVIGADDEIKSAGSARYLSVEADLLHQHGLDAAVLTPTQIASYLRRPGTADFSLGIRRFTNYEWMQRGIPLSQVEEYARRGCRLFTSQASHFLANKAVLARLWRAPDWMSAEDVNFVRRNIPWTARLVDEVVTGLDGSRVGVVEFAIRERERLVVKHTTSMKGEHVFLGRDCSVRSWRDLVYEAVANGRWVVQELVTPTPQHLALWAPGQPEPAVASFDVVLGPIVTDSRVTGIYARAAPRGTGVITGVLPSNIELSAVSAPD